MKRRENHEITKCRCGENYLPGRGIRAAQAPGAPGLHSVCGSDKNQGMTGQDLRD